MNEQILGFIGAGNMAASLIGGLVSDGYPPGNIWVADVDDAKVADLGNRFGVRRAAGNPEIAAHADVLVMAVKPQVLKPVALEIATKVLERRPLVISIAAGVAESAIELWLGGDTALVRCMPNTPALVKAGATALHANRHTGEAQRSQAESVLRAVGMTVWVEREELLDAVTALSGSGPAYYFLLMEAMEDAAVSLGLDRTTARLLTQQTALGAARIAIESEEPPAELRQRVTSPGGTTERAIGIFEQGGFSDLVADAMAGAAARSAELSQQLGE